ncbi:MAG: hypothetical protein RR573_09665, partial [Oscillospiraceae bacterium]
IAFDKYNSDTHQTLIHLKSIGCQPILEKYCSCFDLALLNGEVADYRETLRLAVIGDADFDSERCHYLLSLLDYYPVSLTLLEM